MTIEEIIRRFTYHPPTPDGAKTMTALRGKVCDLAMEIAATCPDSREASLAITKLEEVAYWAIASLARPSAAGGK